MTNQPTLGPIGQRDPGGARQGPLFGETPTWARGRRKPRIKIDQAQNSGVESSGVGNAGVMTASLTVFGAPHQPVACQIRRAATATTGVAVIRNKQ